MLARSLEARECARDKLGPALGASALASWRSSASRTFQSETCKSSEWEKEINLRHKKTRPRPELKPPSELGLGAPPSRKSRGPNLAEPDQCVGGRRPKWLHPTTCAPDQFRVKHCSRGTQSAAHSFVCPWRRGRPQSSGPSTAKLSPVARSLVWSACALGPNVARRAESLASLISLPASWPASERARALESGRLHVWRAGRRRLAPPRDTPVTCWAVFLPQRASYF